MQIENIKEKREPKPSYKDLQEENRSLKALAKLDLEAFKHVSSQNKLLMCQNARLFTDNLLALAVIVIMFMFILFYKV